MIQNLAYCALVEEQLRERVPYGLVTYAGQQVRRVEFTDSNRRWLMHTIAAVQATRLRKQADRNHNQRGYRSWLDDTGAPVGVQQKLMRHAQISTTMNVYGNALMEAKREANTKVVRKALRSA